MLERWGHINCFGRVVKKRFMVVGMLVADKCIEKVLDVERMSGRLMVVRVKEEFIAMLEEVVSGIDSGERLLICGDLIGHVGSEIDGLEGVHEGFGFGKWNVEGEMIFENCRCIELGSFEHMVQEEGEEFVQI